MNKSELRALRWSLVDANNDLEGLKKQWSKIRPGQVDAVQAQIHAAIMTIADDIKK